eukprot:6172569-Pleurochrysis_carterae.AAC.1
MWDGRRAWELERAQREARGAGDAGALAAYDLRANALWLCLQARVCVRTRACVCVCTSVCACVCACA